MYPVERLTDQASKEESVFERRRQAIGIRPGGTRSDTLVRTRAMPGRATRPR